MVRADNPGGRARVITILQNRNLIVGGLLVDGLRIDEIGTIVATPAVEGPNHTIITPAVIDTAYHANIWFVEPLRTVLKNMFTGTTTGDEDQDNDVWDQIKRVGTAKAKEVIAGIKSPGGYMTATNVLFILANTIDTPRRVWC